MRTFRYLTALVIFCFSWIVCAGENHPPLGKGKGINPGRVVWVYNPLATPWEGPGKGHFWEPQYTDQKQVDEMIEKAVANLTGDKDSRSAWDKIFKYFNREHGRGDVGYQRGEKIYIKVNFVGFILTGGNVNPDTYKIERRIDYMNTSPQVILAVLKQLVNVVGVKEEDISVGDGLTYFPNEYYDYLRKEFPKVNYIDGIGKFGRVKIERSDIPIYWSCRPENMKTDYVPSVFTKATYLINLANLKAHTGAGITLCAKNHFGSLIRAPVANGYYDLHKNTFAKETGIYRPNVDLMGHSQIGGKTLLYIIDGLYSGKHPIDAVPRRWNSPPFNGGWTASIFVSQDPVAIDSVGLDFLRSEYDDYPQAEFAGDYLHEAALADNPPSKTFYDPDNPKPIKRLQSLGVHEHWNNPQEKKYSRNLGKTEGIELVSILLNKSGK